MLEIIQIPVLNDNYVYLIHDPEALETAVVDPAVAGPVLEHLQQKNWQLTHLLNTHHHSDHVGGNKVLKNKTGCTVYGSKSDWHRIPGIDVGLTENDTLQIGSHSVNIIETPGHTTGHIVYHFFQDNALFCGDTLFVMGCGRLFEGTPGQMYESLAKLRQLPEDTKIYCAHEYTLNNAQFALTIEPDNLDLKQSYAKTQQLRAKNIPTVPSTLKQETMTNPFMRTESKSIRKYLNLENAESVEVFAKTRHLKDIY